MPSDLKNENRETNFEEDKLSADDEETVVLTEDEFTDNVGDVSVEINVEELVAEIEANHGDDSARKKAVRQRLEEIAEDQSFEDTYAVEFEDD
jgi:hypothetical protein